MSGDTFDCYKWREEGDTGIWWIEARGAINILPYRGQPPQQKRIIPPQRGSNAEIEETIIDLTVTLNCSNVKVVVQVHNLLPLIPKCP